MSLINDALRKAQRQRSGEDAEVSAPRDGPHAGPELRRSPRPSRNALLVGAGVLGGALLVVLVVALLPRRPAAAPSVPPSRAAAVAEAEAPLRLAPADPIVLTVPSPPPPLPSIRPEAPAGDPAPSLAATAAPPSPAPISLVGPPVPGARFVAAVDAFRVAGIRAAGADSKVLMNDRVFRVGDLVERDLGIRLTGASADSLTFTDSTGATYTRYF